MWRQPEGVEKRVFEVRAIASMKSRWSLRAGTSEKDFHRTEYPEIGRVQECSLPAREKRAKNI
jgi:hypothetical protein